MAEIVESINAEVERTLTKSGENVIHHELKRTGRPNQPFGLHFYYKIHPRFEEFIAGLGTGEATSMAVQPRQWTFLPKERDMRLYDLHQFLGLQRTGKGVYFRLDRPGQPLVEDGPDGKVVNMSFLRIVGASSGEGITFLTRGVHEESTIMKLADDIAGVCAWLHQSYLKPVGVSYDVIAQQL